MRIWSVHPKYLDAKGIVALWRETLLARKVLQGETKGYKNHPQLNRFRKAGDPLSAINLYLSYVFSDAAGRGYNFNREKINRGFKETAMTVTRGQLNFEFRHLLHKLKSRDQGKFREIADIGTPDAHPLFIVIDGEIEAWEKIGDKNIR